MRRLRVLASSGLVVALFASGCTADPEADGDGIQPIEVENDEDEAAPEPEPEPEPESEPEPEVDPEPEVEPTDPFAFDDPAEIDVDYVDRVMAELLAVESAVLDDVLESDTSDDLTQNDAVRLAAVLSGPRLVDAGQQMQLYATDEGVRSVFLERGDRSGLHWETLWVVLTQQDCVVAVGVNDVSGVAVEPFPPNEAAVVVLSGLTDAERLERNDINPTPWQSHDLQRLIYSDSGEPVPESEWRNLDYLSFLSLPCEPAQ